jgi:outer membrane protein OmpA-like peptidoglycan-associated protein
MFIFRWLFLVLICTNVFAGQPGKDLYSKNNSSANTTNPGFIQGGFSDTTVIRFDYKQSALFHAFTFEAIDSIVSILLANHKITLTIEGYAYKDEGSDTICYYLSLNRALFLQTYILGRGVDSSRIISLNAYGNTRQQLHKKDKDGLTVNCKAEIVLNYPPKPKTVTIQDKDEDGIVDTEDKCPDHFGRLENKGCPVENMVIVPFAIQESALYPMTYKVLDSVVTVLKENPGYTVSIEGHAFRNEGIQAVCDLLANERANIVKDYLASRLLSVSRITAVKSYGNLKPVNAGKTPQDALQNARAEIIFSRQ